MKMKKMILISFILIIGFSSISLGKSKLKWSFEYIPYSQKHIEVELSPDWVISSKEFKAGEINQSEEYWLPNLKSIWRCKVDLLQQHFGTVIKEQVTLSCDYNGELPSVISIMNCYFYNEKQILVHSEFDTEPLNQKFRIWKLGLIGSAGADNDKIYTKCEQRKI